MATGPGPDRAFPRPAGALRPKLRERDAADIIHALMSPEVYRLLVGDRGWPPERYEQWLRGNPHRPAASSALSGHAPASPLREKAGVSYSNRRSAFIVDSAINR